MSGDPRHEGRGEAIPVQMLRECVTVSHGLIN